jgi:hypothetical protein
MSASLAEKLLKQVLWDEPPAGNTHRRKHPFSVGKGSADTENFGRFLDGIRLPLRTKAFSFKGFLFIEFGFHGSPIFVVTTR